MDAARFAAEQHHDDLRKGTDIPYLSHLWSVAALVLEHGGDDDQVMAALLHDVVEDHGGAAMLVEIRAAFGDEVARLVEGLSDSVIDTTAGEAKVPWAARKEHYLAHLAEADRAHCPRLGLRQAPQHALHRRRPPARGTHPLASVHRERSAAAALVLRRPGGRPRCSEGPRSIGRRAGPHGRSDPRPHRGQLTR